MKIFNSIAYDAIYGKFLYFVILCGLITIIPSPFLVVVGIVSVLGLFKTAMEIDEFNSRYKEIITNLDFAKDINYGDKAIKKDGEWL